MRFESCCVRDRTCISEELIRTTADAMQKEGFVAAGYNYIQIDDCWAASARDAAGAIVPDPVRFPSGMKALSEYVGTKGMKLGLYGDIGSSTCGGFIGFNVSAQPDPVQDAKLAADAETMMSWGMASLKVDGCNADFAAMNITYPKLGAALEAAAKKAGKPSPWYSCSWPDYVGDVLCNHERKEPCVPLHAIAKACNSARLYMDINDSWSAILKIISFWQANPQFAELRNTLPEGESYFNDPDQLMVGNPGLSVSEAQAQMGMWALWSAPMIISTDLRNGSMAPDMKAILLNEGALAISDDPLGRQATECVHAGCKHGGVLYGGATSIWNKTLADGSVAVGLLNTGNFGDVGPTFGDFNISFTPHAVGLHCPAAVTADSASPADTAPSTDSSTGGSSTGGHFNDSIRVGNGWAGPINQDYSDTDCPNVGCHSNLNLGLCESACDGLKGCNAMNFNPSGGCCLRACDPDKLIKKNATSSSGISYYRVGPAPPPCTNIKTKAECLDPLCHWSGQQCTLPPPPPPSGPFEVYDIFKNVSLGIRHGEGFWAEVDESSLLLLRIVCKA
jgi:alpha-galactosidase